MKRPLQFLIRFVLTAAIVFMLWKPFSLAYLTVLRLETNAIFALAHHGVRLELEHGEALLAYSGLIPASYDGPEREIRIPILRRIAIHYNLIMLIALFVATSPMPNARKAKGIAVGIALLSVLHVLHIYYISYLFIWNYAEWRRWPAGISEDQILSLIGNIKHRFPDGAKPWILGLYTYWNHFVREGAPILIWAYFAYPVLFRRKGAGNGAKRY